VVFERGVEAIPLSIDLWIHYLNFFVDQFGSVPSAQHKIRSLYDRAVVSAGLEFRSDKLWDHYIQWETSRKRVVEAFGVFKRLIAVPTQLYSANFEKFKTFVQSNNPQELLSETEYIDLAKKINEKKKKKEEEEEDDDDEEEPASEQSNDAAVEHNGPPNGETAMEPEEAPAVDEPSPAVVEEAAKTIPEDVTDENETHEESESEEKGEEEEKKEEEVKEEAMEAEEMAEEEKKAVEKEEEIKAEGKEEEGKAKAEKMEDEEKVGRRKSGR